MRVVYLLIFYELYFLRENHLKLLLKSLKIVEFVCIHNLKPIIMSLTPLCYVSFYIRIL